MACRVIYSDRFVEHFTGRGHPECPERYTAVKRALEEAKLMEDALQNDRLATVEELSLCHTPRYIQILDKETQSLPQTEGVHAMLSTGDAEISSASYEIARLAAGAALSGVDALMDGKAERIFCLIRPPGHHAHSDSGRGFCLFNSVALAARYAQKHWGVRRALIIDWDLHHGDGTQEIFWSDPSVFYFSTHRFGLFYPGTGAVDESGVGNIENHPIEKSEKSREAVLQAFEEHLKPFLQRVQPELTLISAGFDGHASDPMDGGLGLQTEDYAHLTRIVTESTDTKVLSVLEGGYDLEALSASAVAHVKALGTDSALSL